MNIHEFVHQMKERFEIEIRDYIQELLESIAKQLSQEHNISENDLMNSINQLLDHSVKKCSKITKQGHPLLDHSVKKCSKITKQGHPCKYDAKIGNDLCTKHMNMI